MRSPDVPRKVLIVDDSRTIRRLIKSRLSRDPRIVVVGEAEDAYQAKRLVSELSPDVLTLDIEMPGMNGLEFLRKLMRVRPVPVVMISAETQQGSERALEALSLGAVDCVGKPGPGGLATAFSDLAELLYCAAGARLRPPQRSPVKAASSVFHWNGRVVLVGSSTGGVDALEIMLADYPENCPPTLITQHMPKTFLSSFARRLDSKVAPHVVLAEDGMGLEQGKVYLAPGGETHLTLDWRAAPLCRLLWAEKCGGYRPSVEVLFRSAIPWANRISAVMLTGMGRDGAAAMRRLRDGGAECFAQDEATSAVYGMPRAAIENGAVDRGLPITEIASAVLGTAQS